ncbi:MAG: hypothetical protein Q4B26_05375 [Eubacteriales bacterium]|nr:hypothetical protein [Eubacteriales bacterium]
MLNVTVDSEGKISDISIKEADGNWDTLLGEVKGNCIGTYVDLSADDGKKMIVHFFKTNYLRK